MIKEYAGVALHYQFINKLKIYKNGKANITGSY